MPAPESEARPSSEAQRFATAVLTARTERQMSRVALAEQAGVSLQVVEDLERGYPVPREVASALCRNLDLPEPDLESNPVIRFALLLRQRRGQARMSRAQLAGRVGGTSQVIRALESASQWPSQQVCMGLLAIEALHLQESDVAAFLRPAPAEAAGGSSGEAPTPPSPNPDPQKAAEPTERPRRSPGRPAGSGAAPSVQRSRGPAGTQVVATVLVRFYANGRVALEMRPPRPRLRREAPAGEASRRGAPGPRDPSGS